MSKSLAAVNMNVEASSAAWIQATQSEKKPWSSSLARNYKPVWVEVHQTRLRWVDKSRDNNNVCFVDASTIRKHYLFPVAYAGPAAHSDQWELQPFIIIETKCNCICVCVNMSEGVFVMAVMNVSLVDQRVNTGEERTLSTAIPIWLN